MKIIIKRVKLELRALRGDLSVCRSILNLNTKCSHVCISIIPILRKWVGNWLHTASHTMNDKPKYEQELNVTSFQFWRINFMLANTSNSVMHNLVSICSMHCELIYAFAENQLKSGSNTFAVGLICSRYWITFWNKS